MLYGVLIITIAGFLAGEAAGKLGLPKLIGMLLAGAVLGPYLLDYLPQEILDVSEEIRYFALLIILLKAGLGLDKEKLLNQGTVALRLGFLPAIIEAAVVAVAARWLLGWDWLVCWLLGWIICAASPAVIVPSMLRLKAEGWGGKKGIPDLVLAGGTASDAVAVTMFGIFLGWIIGEMGETVVAQLVSIPVNIVLGIIFGYAAGKTVHFLLHRIQLAEDIVHDLIISLGFGLLLVLGEHYLPYSSFLAVMVMGFTILETDNVLARRLRTELDKIWTIGEIFLFVLIGAAVNITVAIDAGLMGLAIIGIGLIVGRWVGIALSTWGAALNPKERRFMVVGQMAKATVQAAIGGIPLAMGVPHGEYILALSVLSILFTAPAGAFGTAFLAPRMLEKGKVDPTKVTVKDSYRFLVAMDRTPASKEALKEAARIARQSDAELIILHAFFENEPKLSREEMEEELKVAGDIAHELIVVEGNPAEMIVETARKEKVDYIYMGRKGTDTGEKTGLGANTGIVLTHSEIPVILI